MNSLGIITLVRGYRDRLTQTPVPGDDGGVRVELGTECGTIERLAISRDHLKAVRRLGMLQSDLIGIGVVTEAEVEAQCAGLDGSMVPRKPGVPMVTAKASMYFLAPDQTLLYEWAKSITVPAPVLTAGAHWIPATFDPQNVIDSKYVLNLHFQVSRIMFDETDQSYGVVFSPFTLNPSSRAVNLVEDLAEVFRADGWVLRPGCQDYAHKWSAMCENVAKGNCMHGNPVGGSAHDVGSTLHQMLFGGPYAPVVPPEAEEEVPGEDLTPAQREKAVRTFTKIPAEHGASGWQVIDGLGTCLADVDTEAMADLCMAHLLKSLTPTCKFEMGKTYLAPRPGKGKGKGKK